MAFAGARPGGANGQNSGQRLGADSAGTHPRSRADRAASRVPDAPPRRRPVLHVLLESIELDGVRGGKAAPFSLPVANVGDADAEIDAAADCSCTVIVPQTTLAPGEVAVLHGTVTTGLTWRSVTRTLTLLTNDPAAPSIRVPIHLQVTPAFTIVPSASLAVPYRSLGPVAGIFNIRFAPWYHPGAPGPPRVTTDGAVKVTVSGRGAGWYRVQVTIAPPAAGGDVDAVIHLFPSNGPAADVQLALLAQDQIGGTVSPRLVHLRPLSPFSIGSVGVIDVASRNPDFAIVSATSSDPHLAVSKNSLDEAGSKFYRLVLNYNGGWLPGEHRGVITLRTNISRSPAILVPFKGTAVALSR